MAARWVLPLVQGFLFGASSMTAKKFKKDDRPLSRDCATVT